ncbi:MAG: SoxR reducing system RseC family protein [Alistipes sp.]|nr:SoxR reducing system RseC family protein [Alistipes sp.]
MATNNVTHSGKVIGVFRDTVTVAVESSEACGSCASRSACSLGVQSNTRNILITTPNASSFSVGEIVRVATRTQMGLLAVLLCYAMPAVVLVAVLAAAVLCGVSEGVAALISLGSVAIYFGILWLVRDKLAQKISFTIEKL